MDIAVLEKDLQGFISKHGTKYAETDLRIRAIEQKLTAPSGGRDFNRDSKSIAALLTESDGFKAMQKGATRTGQIKIGHLHKDANNILSPTGLDQPLVGMYRVPGILAPGLLRLTVRDLMPSLPTASNMIAYTRETGFTNAAAPQAGEGTLKAESTLTFALANVPVQTLAHWIPASRQIIEDAPALEAYINARLLYGLKLVEEHQLLSGDGIGNDLSGLIANSTAFDTSHDVGSDTLIDSIGRAILQVQDGSNLEADGIIVNNRDWWGNIRLLKDTLGRYLLGSPQDAAPPRLFNLPVVATKSMPYGSFMVGAFRMAAAIWDRDDATVEVSREHQDYFVRNLVAILTEERLALTVYRPLALVYGAYPLGS
jgi:hypothetical protein